MTSVKSINSVQIEMSQHLIENSVQRAEVSAEYVRAIMKISTLNILYRRINLAEDEFIHKNFDNIDFVVSRHGSKNVFVREYHSWMTAFKDAFMQRRIKEFRLFLTDNETNRIEEYYEFKFRYGTESDYVKCSAVDVKRLTNELLNGLRKLGTYQKLQNISAKAELLCHSTGGFAPLHYTNKTSLSYLNEDSDFFVHRTRFGPIKTGFHNFLVKMRMRNLIVIVGDDDEEEMGEPKLEAGNSKTIPDDYFDLTVNTSFSSQISSVKPINCMCGITFTAETVECTLCTNLYHIYCLGYVEKSMITSPFVCPSCGPNSDQFNMLDENETKIFCRIRFILAHLYKFPEAVDKIFEEFVGDIDLLLENDFSNIFYKDESNGKNYSVNVMELEKYVKNNDLFFVN